MGIEIFVLNDTDNMNLGETRTTYNEFYSLKNDFFKQREEYKTVIETLNAKKSGSISKSDRENAERLYDSAMGLKNRLKNLGQSLESQAGSLIEECRKAEQELQSYKNHSNKENLEFAALLFKDAEQLIDGDESDPAEKLVRAREIKDCYDGLLGQIKAAWLTGQDEKIKNLDY